MMLSNRKIEEMEMRRAVVVYGKDFLSKFDVKGVRVSVHWEFPDGTGGISTHRVDGEKEEREDSEEAGKKALHELADAILNYEPPYDPGA